MTVTRYALFATLAVLVAIPLSARAGNDGVVPQHEQPGPRPAAGIEERIGNPVPLDLALRDENEQPITLRECMAGKPTILVPVYYRCPMLCTEILNGLLDAMREMPDDFNAGNQFNVVTISMDYKEHSDLAREKKQAYIREYGRPGAENGWRFLTGKKEAIAELMDSVGYRFEFDKMMKEYNHPSGIIILSPDGRVMRYFYGIDYGNSRIHRIEGGTTTLRLSILEAADGKGGSLLDKLTLLCYRYDRLHKGYSLNVLRAVQAGGILTILGIATGVFFMLRREWRRAPSDNSKQPGADAATDTKTGGLPAGGTT